jgi:hypothetical protein
MSNSLNIQQLITVAEALDDLKDRVIFVGGSTTALLVDSVASGKARQTQDVDFIIDITVNAGAYHEFEEKMRSLGFVNDISQKAPICRWLINHHGFNLKVDAMPTDPSILGFSNVWYQKSIDTAVPHEIKAGLSINVIHPVYFLGTKIEAYNSRGGGDIFAHDLEDIVYVLEHSSTIERDVYGANLDIKSYLSDAFKTLLLHPDMESGLSGLLDEQSAKNTVLGKMKFIADKC